MKEIRTLTIIQKGNEKVVFCQDERIIGNTSIKSYDVRISDVETDRCKHFERVTKEEGNLMYKEYIQKGYKFKDSYSFEPTKMDMR